MIVFHFGIPSIIFVLLCSIKTESVVFEIEVDSDPNILAADGCVGQFPSCFPIASGSIELFKAKQFNLSLTKWKFNKYCNCSFPPRREKLHIIQYLHIPKTGSSINWFLHDYYDCFVNSSNPCSSFLSTVSLSFHSIELTELFDHFGILFSAK